MTKRIKISLAAILGAAIICISLSAGCLPGVFSGSTGPDSSLLGEAWDVITRNYVEPATVEPQTLDEGAIKGMVQALNDPYSAYFTPDEYGLVESTFQDSFSGIGAQVSLNQDNQAVIVAPIEGSPAAQAGLQTGDIILAVDGESTQGLSLTEVVLLVRGSPGTTVDLLVQREGETTPFDVNVVRAQINAPTVSYEMKGDISYLKISTFGDRTNEEFNTALQSLDLANSTGIIIDLRDNPGGTVSAVVDVASHFIKEGVIVTLVDNKGERTSQSATPGGIFTDLPIVVLVNQYSASGSEVLSGALQDYHRATIAGTVTLGKGSYDSFFQLNDGSAIYLTIGRWLTPNGRAIEGEGITPHYTLTQTGDDEIQWAIDFLHDNQN